MSEIEKLTLVLDRLNDVVKCPIAKRLEEGECYALYITMEVVQRELKRLQNTPLTWQQVQSKIDKPLFVKPLNYDGHWIVVDDVDGDFVLSGEQAYTMHDTSCVCGIEDRENVTDNCTFYEWEVK